MRPPRPTPLLALLVASAAAALVWHASLFHFFVTDDAYISFVYARNLAQHGQLVFNLGERVEGYTNFLWTVLLAALLRLGFQPESSSIVVGVALAIATMLLCTNLSRRLRAGARGGWSPWDAVPSLLLAALPSYACWAGGGLETQLFTFLFTLGAAIYLESGPGVRSGLALGLAGLTRPEGDLFFALILVHCSMCAFLMRRPPFDRAMVRQALAFSSLVVPHFVWRRVYYGWWLPNTFYIKSSGGAGTWQLGWHYLWRFSSDCLLPLLMAMVAVGWLVRRSNSGLARIAGLLAVLVPAFYIYVASVGGDFMGLYRFALPIVPLLVVAAVLALAALVAPLAARAAWVAPAVCALLIGGYVARAVPVRREALRTEASLDRGIIDPPGFLRWYTEDRAAIGRWFGQFAQPDDYAVVGGAGAQVYYSGIPSLDAFGLSDAYIAHHVPARSSRPGHQKYAPLDYQLARRPTIITSTYYYIGAAPLVRDDAQFWRARGYHYVSVQIPGLSSPWYTFLKRMDRRIGPLAPIDPDLN